MKARLAAVLEPKENQETSGTVPIRHSERIASSKEKQKK